MPRQSCASVEVANGSAWETQCVLRNKKAQNATLFAQEVCRETPLEKTHVTNEEYVEAMWKSFGKTALFPATSFQKKDEDADRDGEKHTQTSSSSERPWSEVLWL